MYFSATVGHRFIVQPSVLRTVRIYLRTYVRGGNESKKWRARVCRASERIWLHRRESAYTVWERMAHSPAPLHAYLRWKEGEVPALSPRPLRLLLVLVLVLFWSCPIGLGERIVDSIANCHW